MDRKTLTGAILATAVGAMFLTTPVLAQSSSGDSTSQASVKCVGGNSCKGQSACKSASNSCGLPHSAGFAMNVSKCARLAFAVGLRRPHYSRVLQQGPRRVGPADEG